MADEGEVKQSFSIKVRSHRGEEVHFKVKPHTVMDKVIKAFCAKVGVDASTIRLTFDGQRVEGKQTVQELDLEDGDILDAMEFQVMHRISRARHGLGTIVHRPTLTVFQQPPSIPLPQPIGFTPSRGLQTKYNTVPTFTTDPDNFVSRHATIDKDEILRYLERKNLTFKELPDKVLVCECPLCPKPTYGKADNMWKLCVFFTGGFVCLRCGEKGSFYEFKKRLGDLPIITGINGAPRHEMEPQILSQTDAQTWVSDLEKFPAIVEYLTQTRGLTLEVLKKYCVGAKMHRFPGEAAGAEWVDHECIVFPWTTTRTINGTDVMYTRAKVRSLADKSCMRLLPRGGEWGLFGWHTVPMDAEEVIITEGEFDAMAVYQATGLPAVSLPNGCRSLPPQLLPCLERFKRIVLWMDDDTAGHEGAENMVHKLGLQRCHVVPGDYGAKDANEALLKGMDIDQLLHSAGPYAHKQIASFPSFRADVKRMFTEPNAHVGVPFANMPHLQSLLKGHRRGEVTIITGSTGVGKTTILSQLSLEVAQQGVPTLWGSFEIRNPRLARTMMKQYAALLGIELNEQHPEAFDHVADRFEELPFFFLKFYGSSPVQEVIEAMEYAVYVHDVQHIILDNLQFMLSGQGRASGDKFELQDRAIEAFRQFASQRNVHVSLVIHPRKEADNSSLGLASVFGSAKATQEADNVLIIQAGLPRSLTKPLGLEKGGRSKGPDLSQGGGFEDPITGEIMATFFRTLELRKNRWDGDLGSIPLRFEKSSGRLYELTKEDVQSGLTEFVEKHRKLKQLDLIKHMSQHNSASTKSGFESHQVQKANTFVQQQVNTSAPQAQPPGKPTITYQLKQQGAYASKPPPQSAALPPVAGQAIPLPPPVVGPKVDTGERVVEISDAVIESVMSTGVDPRERRVTQSYLNELEEAISSPLPFTETPPAQSSMSPPFKKVETPRLHTPSLDIIFE